MHKKKYLVRAFSKENKTIYMGVISLGLNDDGVPTHIMDVDILKYIQNFASSHRHNFRDFKVDDFLEIMNYDRVEVSSL